MLEQAMRRIGLAGLEDQQLVDAYQRLVRAIRSGIEPQGGVRGDADLLAVQTGIPLATHEAWSRVPNGRRSLGASVSGTNWEFRVAEKISDSDVRVGDPVCVSYPVEERRITFSTLVGRMADPLARLVRSDGAVSRLGVAFGFPHLNVSTELGIDAELVTPDGSLTKGWQLTDWASLPPGRRLLGDALRTALLERGVELTTLTIVNDTPAVALDIAASSEAREAGYDVQPVGLVGGTGTNAAIDVDGLINLELGYAGWPDTDVTRRMRANEWSEGGPYLEHETGMYLVYRLAAGVQLLSEEGVLGNGDAVVESIMSGARTDPSILSHLATAGSSDPRVLSMLARTVLLRSGQVYGVVMAALSEVTAARSRSGGATSAMLTEGSVLLRADGVRAHAQAVSDRLGHRVEIVPASGLRGVAALSLSLPNGHQSSLTLAR